jgi:hypothetical protein
MFNFNELNACIDNQIRAEGGSHLKIWKIEESTDGATWPFLDPQQDFNATNKQLTAASIPIHENREGWSK